MNQFIKNRFFKMGLFLAFIIGFQVACASRTPEIITAGVVGSAVGAGLGYAVVHHGPNRKYVLQNTIISSALLGLTFAGVTAYHYRALEKEKIAITSKLGRSYLLESADKALPRPWEVEASFTPTVELIKDNAIQLDSETYWVLPSFRKKNLRPEADTNEFLSSRFVWEVVRPGFFTTPSLNFNEAPRPELKTPKKDRSNAQPPKDLSAPRADELEKE
jgi:phosphate/sulfate permease